MMTIEECRKYLGSDGKDITDEQVKEIRDTLYAFIELSLDCYFEETMSKQ